MLFWLMIIAGIVAYGVYFFWLVISPTSFKKRKKCIQMIVIFTISIVIGTIGVVCVSNLKWKETVKIGNFKLLPLSDSSIMDNEEQFYIQVNLDTESTYIFYYQSDNGGFEKAEVNSKNVKLIDTEECTPDVEVYTTYSRNNMSKIWRAILVWNFETESDEKNYVIHVPERAIVTVF